MGYSASELSNASIDSFGVDRSLMSALGHAHDDPQRFLQGCMKLVDRSYTKVSRWFENFNFLDFNDRNDALQIFFLTLSHKLMTEKLQSRIQEFREDEQHGKSRFRSYLYQVARSAAIDFARSLDKIHSREQRLIEGEVAAQAQDLFSEIINQDIDQMLEDIKTHAKISEHEWEIFLASLKYSREEVASRLKLKSVEAVSSANYRVNNKLTDARIYIMKTYGHVGSLILSDSKAICNL